MIVIDKTKDQVWSLYMHVNKVNGLIYVGITSCDPLKRWANGNGYSSQKYFYSEIQKFGWNAFEHIIIKDHLTMEKASELEKEYIQKYDSFVGHNGYNTKSGGFCGALCGRKVTAFDENYNFVVHYNSIGDARDFQCNSSIRKSIDEKCFTAKGYIWFLDEDLVDGKIPKDIIPQIDRSMILQPIYQFSYSYETRKVKFEKEYKNFHEVCDTYQIIPSNLYFAINEEKICKGFIFKYKNQIPDIKLFEEQYEKPYIRKKCLHVLRISYTKEITEYDSVYDACEDINIEQSEYIRQCCLGLIPTAHGYFWRYADDVNDIDALLNSLDYSYLEKHIPVLQYTKDGTFVKEYNNAFDAYLNNKDLFDKKYDSSGRILLCCRNEIKSSKGYIWIFKCNIDTIKDRVGALIGNANSRPLIQFDQNGNYIKRYNSSTLAEIETGVKKGYIVSCCKGTYLSAGGYIWLYEKEYNENNDILKKHLINTVLQLNSDFEIINEFKSVNQASNYIRNKNSDNGFYSICRNGKLYKGYYWMFKDDYMRRNKT